MCSARASATLLALLAMAIMALLPATSRALESLWASLDADLELGLYEIWRGYVVLELADTRVGSLYFPRGRGFTILGLFLTKTSCLAWPFNMSASLVYVLVTPSEHSLKGTKCRHRVYHHKNPQ